MQSEKESRLSELCVYVPGGYLVVFSEAFCLCQYCMCVCICVFVNNTCACICICVNVYAPTYWCTYDSLQEPYFDLSISMYFVLLDFVCRMEIFSEDILRK